MEELEFVRDWVVAIVLVYVIGGLLGIEMTVRGFVQWIIFPSAVLMAIGAILHLWLDFETVDVPE